MKVSPRPALSAIFLFASFVAPCAIADEAKPAEAPKIPADRLSVREYFDLETPSDPRISPGGQRIVYVRGWNDIKTDKSYSNLWIIDFEGTNHRPLTTGKRNDSAPRWSPDGGRIAFISSADGAPQIYVMWLDSGQSARITNLQKPPSNPVWSPDGKWIAFNMFVAGKKPEGVKMPAKPEGAEWAEAPTVIERMTYRSDGAGYLPEGFRHVFIAPAEGGTERQITNEDYEHGTPEWSADGQSILTSAIRKPEAEWIVDDTEIYSFSIADGAAKALTDRRGPDASAALSPDGSRIAYAGFDEKRLAYTVTRLYTMASDGADPKCLTPDFDLGVQNAKWTTDGKEIVFTADQQGSTQLYQVSEKNGPEALTEGVQQIGAFTLGPKGRIAAIVSTPDRPGEVHAWKLGEAPRRITETNEDLLGHRKVGALEEIWYKSSFDGKDIQGWIIKPPGFDPAKQYPLVLYIHGGPHAMYGVAFNFEFQTLAAADYVVLYTNPRGSTGYGQEFGNSIQFKYPGDDYFDLMSGVDETVKRGYIDEKQMYVTGGSGGGVLTCWVIGRTDRFRAAVSQFPVINWYSFVGTADFGYDMGWRWFEKWPWDDSEHYMKRSPISLVGNVKTPTKLITGESDWRTPISETEQYFRALRIQKKEAVMVRVPDEPHGVRARPSHFVAKMLHVREWFEKYKEKPEEK